jgi:hypothetical protein
MQSITDLRQIIPSPYILAALYYILIILETLSQLNYHVI